MAKLEALKAYKETHGYCIHTYMHTYIQTDTNNADGSLIGWPSLKP
jgi:hypothetical protein